MFLEKQNIDNIKESLIKKEIKADVLYLDLEFYLKDIGNPAFDYSIKYLSLKKFIEHFTFIQKYLESNFNIPVHLVLATKPIKVEGIPNFRKEFFEKYLPEENEDVQIKRMILAFETVASISIVEKNEKFINPSSLRMDGFEFIKKHKGNRHAIVISRDEIFRGYDDMTIITPREMSSGKIEEKIDINYIKVIWSLAGLKSRNLPNIPGIGHKRAESILDKLFDKGIYIYYNRTSESQLIFPISYEDLASVSKITRKQYDEIILPNWAYLNK